MQNLYSNLRVYDRFDTFVFNIMANIKKLTEILIFVEVFERRYDGSMLILKDLVA